MFAYSNRVGDPDSHYCQRALVIYHNRWAEVSGWINRSVAYKDKNHSDDTLVQVSLVDGLGLRNDAESFTIFKDNVTGLQYIRKNSDLFERGLYIELSAYKYHVFLDFQQVTDNEWHQYRQLTQYLDGRGVPDIEDSLKEVFLQPIHYPYKEIVNKGFFQWMIDNRYQAEKPDPENMAAVITEAGAKMRYLYKAISQFSGTPIQIKSMANEICWILDAILKLPALEQIASESRSRNLKAATTMITQGNQGINTLTQGDLVDWGILLGWLFTHNIGKILSEDAYEIRSYRLIEEWLLHNMIAETFTNLGMDPGSSQENITIIKILVKHQNWYQSDSQKPFSTQTVFESWIEDPVIQRYLQINRHQGVVWFNKEAMESLLRWLLTISILVNQSSPETLEFDPEPNFNSDEIIIRYKVIKIIQYGVDASAYQLDNVRNALKGA